MRPAFTGSCCLKVKHTLLCGCVHHLTLALSSAHRALSSDGDSGGCNPDDTPACRVPLGPVDLLVKEGEAFRG